MIIVDQPIVQAKANKTENKTNQPPTNNLKDEKGGTYILKDENGKVQRSGRTNDLGRREKEHGRSEKTKDLEFEVDQRNDDKKVQRGREQQIHDAHKPPLNKIKPIRDNNPKKEEYMKAAEEHMKKQKQ